MLFCFICCIYIPLVIMLRLKFIFFLLAGFILFISFKPGDKYLRKAARQNEKGNIKEAKLLYLKALQLNPENYKANVGLGLLLSEQLDNYEGALPYLEKAYKITGKDTL